MSSVIYTTRTKDLRQIQARMAALVRGIKTCPENALDYSEALEFQLFQLAQTIEGVSSTKIDDPITNNQ